MVGVLDKVHPQVRVDPRLKSHVAIVKQLKGDGLVAERDRRAKGPLHGAQQHAGDAAARPRRVRDPQPPKVALALPVPRERGLDLQARRRVPGGVALQPHVVAEVGGQAPLQVRPLVGPVVGAVGVGTDDVHFRPHVEAVGHPGPRYRPVDGVDGRIKLTGSLPGRAVGDENVVEHALPVQRDRSQLVPDRSAHHDVAVIEAGLISALGEKNVQRIQVAE